MRVAEKLTFQQYWEDPRFQKKKAFFGGNLRRAYGDNIYHKDAGGNWIQEFSHHSYADGSTNLDNLVKDTSYDAVLVSTDFVYWGGEGPFVPPALSNFNGEDLYPHIRDYRVGYTPAFVTRVDQWYTNLPQRGRQGRPDAW